MSIVFNTGDPFGATDDSVFGYQQPMPNAWANAFDTAAPGFSATVDAQTGSSGEPWIQTAMRVASSLVMLDSQRRLLDIQLDRAEKGLPPLNASQYSPSVGVNVGVAADTQKLLILGGLGLLAVFFLLRKG